MLTSLLIVASIWGADPKIVFVDDHVPWTQPLTQRNELPAISTVTRPIQTSNANGMFTETFVARAQTVSDDPQHTSNGSGCSSSGSGETSIFDDPIIRQFIAEINPFAPLCYQVLPNYYDPFGLQMGTGTYGPQGYRLGWSTYSENSIIPAASAYGTTGTMRFFEWRSNAKYSKVVQPGLLFNGTFWFNAQWWDGPSGINLPGQVDLLSSDLELAFFDNGPWTTQVAFHPQIVNSYGSKLDKYAFNFDGRVVTTYKASPEWSFVGGLAIWDRVNTLIVPHVGAVWTPNNRWEVRALFPKSRVSYFLGNWRNADYWLYGQYEYTAQAWQTTVSNPDYSDRMQITDQRLTAGLRWDSGRYTVFTEAGYVFDRQVKFAGPTPGFGLGDAAIVSFGIRY